MTTQQGFFRQNIPEEALCLVHCRHYAAHVPRGVTCIAWERGRPRGPSPHRGGQFALFPSQFHCIPLLFAFFKNLINLITAQLARTARSEDGRIGNLAQDGIVGNAHL